MNIFLPLKFFRRRRHPLKPRPPAQRSRSEPEQIDLENSTPVNISAQVATRILLSLLAPSIMLVLSFAMSGVALPIIREDFQIPADITAWVSTAFILPFMILMPLYGRLSDGVGKRPLILVGIVIFLIGSVITLFATNLALLMLGRVIQGIGSAGLMPLGMAIVSTIFPANQRGKALGTWSSIGPAVGFLAPLGAGFLIDSFGWRAAFGPPLIMGLIAFWVVFTYIPPGLSQIKPDFWRTFDWIGVVLLSLSLISFLFYLSSQPITGVPSLQDWRLLGLAVSLMIGFLWRERSHQNPFVALNIFTNRLFRLASVCASLRMFTMSGVAFLVPLYLVDVYDLSAAYIGGMLMISPGAMTLMVRVGGQLADRWGSRWPVCVGLGVQCSVMVLFARLTETTPLWLIALILGYHGLGAGLVLAALHRAAMGHLPERDMGMAAGLYNMARFSGASVGLALGGVILQSYLDQARPIVEAYQIVFWFFAGLALLGVGLSLKLQEPERTGSLDSTP